MKLSKYNKYGLSLMLFAILVVACMTIEEIIHPDDAKVNTDIEISVKIKIVAETDGNSKLAFGILVPKMWNVAQNSTLTLTTTAAYAANVVTNEPMSIISAGELNPSDAQPWSASFQSRFGVLDNTGPVEWVVFESATTFQIHDKANDGVQKEVIGNIKIKIHTGERAVKFFMGYTFCGKAFGFDGEKYPSKPALASKILEVTGGDLPLWDFTAEPLISFVPTTFSYGDMFSIKYSEPHTVTSGGLKGGNVYLLGTVKYSENGVIKEKSVSETGAKMLMESLGDMGDVTTWQKYIYPKDYFSLPKDAVIVELKLYFSNQNKSVQIMDNETEEGFLISETCE